MELWIKILENSIEVQKIQNELPYDTAIPFFGIYPKNWN